MVNQTQGQGHNSIETAANLLQQQQHNFDVQVRASHTHSYEPGQTLANPLQEGPQKINNISISAHSEKQFYKISKCCSWIIRKRIQQIGWHAKIERNLSEWNDNHRKVKSFSKQRTAISQFEYIWVIKTN